jgi:hypothetical protein
VRSEGHFITADQEYLRPKKDEIKRANYKKVLADFSDVSDIGSAGIGFYRRRLHVRQELRWAFRTRGDTTPRVREVLDITRVSTVIPLAADIASGLVTLCDEGLAAGAQN